MRAFAGADGVQAGRQQATRRVSGQGEAQVTALLDGARTCYGAGAVPADTDVAIIGGGIVGCSTAFFLAGRGMRVALFEKGVIAGEQSGRNWGWVRQQGRAASELPMMMRSLELWKTWSNEMERDTGFTQAGCLYLARNRAELDAHADWLAIAAAHGLATRLIEPPELATILEGAAERWAGALYTPSDGRAEPARATPAIANAAAARGALIHEHCAVRGVETSGGAVSAVVTEHGVTRCQAVVCAAGAWTALFAGSLGVSVPQLRIKGTVARTAPARKILSGTAWAPEVAIRRRADGGYTIAHGSALEHALVPDSLRFGLRFLPAFRAEHGSIRPRLNGDFLRELRQPRRWPLDRTTVFERTRVLHPRPSAWVLREIRAAVAQSFPEIGAVAFEETWAGMIEASPDLIPIIGPVEKLTGFFLATGFSGHGFGLGPGAGECVANLVCGTDPGFDVGHFRPARFFDGSPVRLGPTI